MVLHDLLALLHHVLNTLLLELVAPFSFSNFCICWVKRLSSQVPLIPGVGALAFSRGEGYC